MTDKRKRTVLFVALGCVLTLVAALVVWLVVSRRARRTNG